MPEYLKHFVWLIAGFSCMTIISCNSVNDKIPTAEDSEKFETDTIINGVHIQQNGRIPTKEDFVKMYQAGKGIYDSLKNMKQEDKDSVEAAYKRYLEEIRRK